MPATLNPDSVIYVAGHRGMVGAAIVRQLRAQGLANLITRTHSQLDLCNQAAVNKFFAAHKIDFTVLAAAKVGGIHANNTLPAEFIYQNIIMAANVIHAAYTHGVKRLLFLGSSCIYPRTATQPMSEVALLSGKLEPTNEPYALAKIAGIKLCESYNRQYDCDYRSIMPTNLYGPGDNFHPTNSHVLPALLRRFHEAKVAGADTVSVWGSGKARREFLHVDDMARAAVHVMGLPHETYKRHTQPMLSHLNIGSGQDITIAELSKMIKAVTGFSGKIEFDPSRPDGTPQKLLDVSRINSLGWHSAIDLPAGLKQTYAWFLDNFATIRS